MYYFEYPQIDTTIYEGSVTSSINTGLDQILEINKNMNSAGTTIDVSRVLIKFDYGYISSSVQSGVIPSTAKYYLNLYDASSEELAVEQTLFAYMISGSWTGGTGTKDRDPALSDGASWKYRDNDTTKTAWVGSNTTQGGTWFTSSVSQYNVSASTDLVYETKDIRMDVTDLVKNHLYSGSVYPNNGFILKRENLPTSQSMFSIFDPTTSTGSAEHDTSHQGNLKFFSRETNTIFPPKLEVEWDDSVWNTGSLSPLSSTDLDRLKIYFKNLKPEYKEKSKVKFRFVGRELYPTRGFDTTPAALTVKYLPRALSTSMQQGTYYSVKDAETEDVIIPFSTGSIVSCDSSGNYFNLWMDGFQPERRYRFEIKVVSGSGVDQTSMIYDDEFTFKVVR